MDEIAIQALGGWTYGDRDVMDRIELADTHGLNEGRKHTDDLTMELEIP